jgi:hypothetical protein
MSEAKKTLVILLVAVVVGLLLFFFQGPQKLPGEPLPAAAPAPVAAAPAPAVTVPDAGAPVVAEPAPEPRPEPPDIFAGEAPDVITRNHIRLIDGQTISYDETKRLYDYGVEHQDDPRPQLLLAWDAMQRGWDGMATRLYVKAYKADPRVKELPRTLRDMVSVAMRFDKVEGREAVAAIKDIYGKDALDVVDEMRLDARERHRDQWVQRLDALEAALRASK